MEERNFTYDYFISYRRASGGALAARLVKSILRKYGKNVFLDVDDIKVGEEFKQQIFNAIENSKNYILILNEDSWREKEKIDNYYDEIIRITKQSGDIIPIEFAKGVLNNVPHILNEQLFRDIRKFVKVSYNHEYQYLFEKILCDRLGITYSFYSQNENLPKFSIPSVIEEGEFIKRDDKVKKLCDYIIHYRIYNLIGVGGSGKTTLAYLLADKYKDLFNNIAYVVVNDNIKEDFVSQINATLNLDFASKMSTDEKYQQIISFMEQYKPGNNLLILDVNKIEYKAAIDEDYTKELLKNKLSINIIYPNNWYILILSREKFMDCYYEYLSLDDDKDFVKALFLKKAGKKYNDFEDIDGLLKLIHYSPLWAVQLGVFLKQQPKILTLANIKEILNDNIYINNVVDYKGFTPDEQNILRHFVLWKSEYIGYDIIKDLLKDVCQNLEATLRLLSNRMILQLNSEFAYKLNEVLIISLRQQFDIKNEDWSKYLNNIERIIGYSDDKLVYFVDYIANSMKWIDFSRLGSAIAYRFYLLYKGGKRKKSRMSSLYINKEPIYISYAHNDVDIKGCEHIADVVYTLIDEFLKERIYFKIDSQMNVGDSITEFESAIGRSMYTIVVFNNQYFESHHCMLEYKQILNEYNQKKVIFIKSDNIDLGKKTLRRLYNFWCKEEIKLEFENRDILNAVHRATMDYKYYKTEIKMLNNTISNKLYYKTEANYQLSDANLARLIAAVKNWF